MLRGKFSEPTGRPYIRGRLILPRLNLQGDVGFLVDTGADFSVLHPTDGVDLGINFSALGGRSEGMGVGGSVPYFSEHALLVFAERRAGLHVYDLSPRIGPPAEAAMTLPSLLGRDVLDRWRMVYHPTAGRLTFTVVSADATLPLR